MGVGVISIGERAKQAMPTASGRLKLLGLLAAATLTACSPAGPSPGPSDGAAAPSANQRGLVFVLRSEPPSVAAKPLRVAGLSVASAVRLFNAGLDYVDEREGLHPYLAEDLPKLNTDSWRVFPDGRMETSYRLKPGLAWHDGAPLSAEDFVFAFHVYATPDLGVASSTLPIPVMADVLAPDARTLVIRWTQLFPGADGLKATFQALPRHILQQPFEQGQPEAFVVHPFWAGEYVGLGPYRLERWEPGTFMEGSAFDGHVLGRPKIDRVRVLFMGDPNVVLASLLSGEVHAAVDNSLNSEQALVVEREWAARNDGGVVLYSASQFRATEVQFRPELANPPEILERRVRQALLYAMDRNALNEALIAGKGVVVDTPISSAAPYFPAIEPKIHQYTYDPRRTERLMQEVGFVKGPDGIFVNRSGQRFSPELWAITGGNNDAELQILVDGHRKAGIDAIPKVLPAAVFSDTRARSTFPALSNSSSQNFPMLRSVPPGPSNGFLGGGGRGGWTNAEFDRLQDAFQTTLDRSEQTRLIGEMARVFSEELPLLPIYFNVRVTAFVAGLQGPLLGMTPDAGSDAWNVYLWEWRS